MDAATYEDKKAKLQRLIDGRLLRPYFHAIVDMRCAEVTGYEGLSRPTPESGYTRPDELFDDALDVGLFFEVESLALELMLGAASNWNDTPLVFVNATPSFLADERSISFLVELVERLPNLRTSRVVVEVTERSEVHFDEILSERVDALHSLGFQVAIDDVGAGANGLNRIMRLRPNWLKLDRGLISAVDTDTVRENLLRFMLRFSRLTGVRFIAEGIETEGELNRLQTLGTPFGQGYCFGKPNAEREADEEVLEKLRERIAFGSSSEATIRERGFGLSELTRPVDVVTADVTLGAAADHLKAHPEYSGVVLYEYGHAAGWADRETVLYRAKHESQLGMSIDDIVVPVIAKIDSEASFVEALEVAAARPNLYAQAPLVVKMHNHVCGVILLSDLLHHAATRFETVQPRVSTLTGLPGRVHSEQLLDSLFETGTPDLDVVFVDLRELAVFNKNFGFDAGDDLIRQLAASVLGILDSHPNQSDCRFFGHLGDDRFLVVCSQTVSCRIAGELAESFSSNTERVGGFATSAALERVNGVGVRVLIQPDAFRTHAVINDLFRAEQTMRLIADEKALNLSANVASVVVANMFDPNIDERYNRAA
ncbi:MAG: EAL domain-containing protein [Planctomycetota bacterium]